jgi:hypothetical protein
MNTNRKSNAENSVDISSAAESQIKRLHDKLEGFYAEHGSTATALDSAKQKLKDDDEIRPNTQMLFGPKQGQKMTARERQLYEKKIEGLQSKLEVLNKTMSEVEAKIKHAHRVRAKNQKK